MQMFVYYAWHAFVNQIKKLFKTWVAIFLGVCLVGGIFVGIMAGVVSDFIETEDPEAGGESETLEMTPEEKAELLSIVELIVTGVILGVFALEISRAGKNGSVVFAGADVNLLFPSPRKPQSVLLFRLMTQFGAMLFAGFYLLLQIPNLAMNLHLGYGASFGLMGAWILLLFYAKMTNVLLYTVTSTYPRYKKRIRPTSLALLAALAVGFLLYQKQSGEGYLSAADSFFNAPAVCNVPILGWFKGLVSFSLRGETGKALACLGALLLGIVPLVFIIWHLKADFYEDALTKSTEIAEMQAAVNEGMKARVKRKKDRSERLLRDGLTRGSGADTYFFRTLYNRFRFGQLHFFTKTMETYLLMALIAAVLIRRAQAPSYYFIIILILGVDAFFRSLGNPLMEDLDTVSFFLVPENVYTKLFWSSLGGTVVSALDLLPALAVSAVVAGANPMEPIAGLLFVLSVDLYASQTSNFLGVSLASLRGSQVKVVIQILYLYFGMIPDIAILLIGGVLFEALTLSMVIATVVNLCFGGLFFLLSGAFLERGQ